MAMPMGSGPKSMPPSPPQGGPPAGAGGPPPGEGGGGGIGEAAAAISSGLDAFSQAFSSDESGILSPHEHDLLAATQASFQALMKALQGPPGQSGQSPTAGPAPSGPMPFGSKPGAMPA